MIKIKIKYFLIVIILCFLGLNVSGYKLEALNLKCENRFSPVGINTKSPRLSWQIECREKRNIMQSSFQILVASSEMLLNETDADMWNSGEIENSINIKYKGKKLQSGKRYYWKVRIKDNNGEYSSFSAPSFFETAFLEQDDWKAKWIAAPNVWDWPEFLKRRKRLEGMEDNSPWANNSPLFRKEFQCTKEVESARMYVTGLGYYEAYINGKKVGDHQLDPAFTRYDKTILYAVYDISNLLKGKNAVGIMIGNGWFNMFSKAVWGFDHAPWRGKPRALMQIEVIFTDGTKQIIGTDETWKTAPGPVVFNSVRQGMVYDAPADPKGWKLPGFKEDKWKPVFIVPSPGGILKAQTIEPIRIYKEFSPIEIAKKKDGRYILDFGQNMAGWAKIKVKGRKDDCIILKYGEEVVDNSVFQDNIKVFTNGIVQTDKYVLSGDTTETLETKFTFHGFRFIEVINFPGELHEKSVTAIAANTDLKPRGYFKCSDPLINKIQQNTLWSYRSNFMGYPLDCPQREKNGWTGDAHLAVETGLWNFHSNVAYTKYVEDMADEQQNDGNLPAIIPSSQWGYYQFNGPDWIGAYIIIPWEMYLFNGDREILARHYEGMKKMFAFFTGKAKNYILSYGLGDHTYTRSKRNVSLTSTAYYFKFANILYEISKILDQQEDKLYFKNTAANIKNAFNQNFYNSETGIYGDGSQTNQSCPLFMDLVEEEQKKKVIEQLLTAIKKTDYHIDAGILGAKYLPHALADNGYAKEAYKIITNKTYPGWGWWIQQGATTLWEQWDGRASQQNASLNHIMFGDVSNWFYQNIAGIKPDIKSPGFKHFFIESQLIHHIEWCDAKFESPYGNINVKWEKKNGKLILNLEVPGNTTASVSLPAKTEKEILEGGSSLKKRGIKVFSTNRGTLFAELGSGSYLFEFPFN
jgi:alpha-L-rhamnosidase